MVTGLFYEVRRKYLKRDEDNALEPPQDFMNHKAHGNMMDRSPGKETTRKSMYQQAMEDSNKTSEKFHLQFTRPRDDREAMLSKAQVRRREAMRKARHPKKIVTIVKYSSTKPEDWSSELQAGCHIWINRQTGEVSSTCPWDDESCLRTDTSDFVVEDDSQGQYLGTGSLVYDDKEIHDLFSYLDRIKQKS